MACDSFSRLARAKINLDLLITGRRADGYHLLDSLVAFADYGDQITVTPSSEISLKITGPFGEGLTVETDNLVLQAAHLLRDKYEIRDGVEITLVKNLPVSSGIGGGSADAAATLHALMSLWGIRDRMSDLAGLPLTLGADVPVCMESEAQQMTGVGEELRPVQIKTDVFAVLVNPGVSVATAEIFQSRARRKAIFSVARALPPRLDTLEQLVNILIASGNDLQEDACRAAPEISTVLSQLQAQEGCCFSAMSGSGATCFGLFEAKQVAEKACVKLKERNSSWWGQAVKLG